MFLAVKGGPLFDGVACGFVRMVVASVDTPSIDIELLDGTPSLARNAALAEVAAPITGMFFFVGSVAML